MDRPRPDLSTLTIPRGSRGGGAALLGCLGKLGLLAGVLGALVLGWAEADRRGLVAAYLVPAPVEPPKAARILTPRPAAARGPDPLFAPVLGYVVAARRATIGFSRPGRIKEIFVEVGRTVEAGQVLARLDDALLRAEMVRARAQLDDAKRELVRHESLVKEGVGTNLDRDAMRSRVEVLEAELQLVRENLAQCETTAPFRGIVVQKHAEVGESVGVTGIPGAPAGGGSIVTITDLATPEVEADVPEERVEDLAPEQPALVELDALGGVRLRGVLRIVLPTADRRKATVPARVTLVDTPPRLRPEMSARVTFLSTRKPSPAEIAAEDSAALAALERPAPGGATPVSAGPAAPSVAEALKTASELAYRAEALPWARQAVGGAFGVAGLAWVLAALVRAAGLGGRSPAPLPPPRPAPPPKPAAPKAAPGPAEPGPLAKPGEGEGEDETDRLTLPKSKQTPGKQTPRTQTRHSRSSFRVLKRDSISDVESVEEIYVVDPDDEDPLASDDGEDDDEPVRVEPAGDRRIHALGPSGRITGEPWFLRPHRGGLERPVVELGGVSVPFQVEGKLGARILPVAGARVRIEDVPVQRDGVALVHGMVFHVETAAYVYLDRPPNEFERRRVYVVPSELPTSISGKVLISSDEIDPAEPEPRDDPPRAARAPKAAPRRTEERPRLADAPVLVTIRALEKTYWRGRNPIPILRGLDLDVPKGDFLALMGPSGSGKSTLLNVVGGIDRATAGSVRVAGEEISGYSESRLAGFRSRSIGFVFQFYNLIPVLTAFENVELPLLLTDLSRRDRREHAYHALSLVGMSDRASHRPRELSGGQEQRVAIARAIVTDPPLLVADEPTGDLDAENADLILDLLVRLNTELGKTIVMVTHDPHAAERARRVRRLEKGVLEQLEEPDEVPA